MVGVQASISENKVSEVLKRYLAQDFKTPLAQAGMVLIRSTNQNFKNETSPDGTPWKALARYTVAKRLQGKKSSNGLKILQDTGRLKNSVTSNVTQNLTETTLEFGTNVEYAKLHQFGGESSMVVTRKNKKQKFATNYYKKTQIPARPFLGITESDKNKIRQVFINYFKGKFNA